MVPVIPMTRQKAEHPAIAAACGAQGRCRGGAAIFRSPINGAQILGIWPAESLTKFVTQFHGEPARPASLQMTPVGFECAAVRHPLSWKEKVDKTNKRQLCNLCGRYLGYCRSCVHHMTKLYHCHLCQWLQWHIRRARIKQYVVDMYTGI